MDNMDLFFALNWAMCFWYINSPRQKELQALFFTALNTMQGVVILVFFIFIHDHSVYSGCCRAESDGEVTVKTISNSPENIHIKLAEDGKTVAAGN